jgi:hypothetical protein
MLRVYEAGDVAEGNVPPYLLADFLRVKRWSWYEVFLQKTR